MTLSGMWWSLYTVNKSPNTQPTPSLPSAYSILNEPVMKMILDLLKLYIVVCKICLQIISNSINPKRFQL